MILSELSVYLREHKRAPLTDLANRFDADPDALRGMLETWMQKGKVSKLENNSTCGGCCKCDPASLEVYEWVG